MIEEISIRGHKFLLYPEKAMLWETEGMLMISDMHLGKVNHFRRSGIPIPRTPNDQNMERLIKLLQQVRPKSVLFMGDLFHSHYNEEWEAYGQVLKYFPDISFEFIPGNHDIMSDYQYSKHQLFMHPEVLTLYPFIFTHEPMESVPEDHYNIAGHIHPGVRLRGKGRQGLNLPCFYFGKSHALLPAFGAFTGMFRISPEKEDDIFVIVEEKVIRVA